MNLVQCLHVENPVFPGGASEVRRAEVAIHVPAKQGPHYDQLH